MSDDLSLLRCEVRVGELGHDSQCESPSTHIVNSFGRETGLCDDHYEQWTVVFDA